MLRSVCVALFLWGCNEPRIQPDPGDGAIATPQTLGPIVQTDAQRQRSEARVDVLFVIDESGSMAEEQQRLAANFGTFIQYFVDSDLDWHVGVVSTDMASPARSGRLVSVGDRRWVDRDTPDPEGVFAAMAQLGVGGSNDELGLRAAFRALTDPLQSGHNEGFRREDASLSVVFVTDAEDQSAGDPSAAEFIDFLEGLAEDPEDVAANAIVGGVSGGCEIESPGFAYIEAAAQTGGVSFSICEPDWAPLLDELGRRALGKVEEVYLTDRPVVETLEVLVLDGDYVRVGELEGRDACDSCFAFRYAPDRNAVVFVDYVPPQGARIEVTYELEAGPRGPTER